MEVIPDSQKSSNCQGIRLLPSRCCICDRDRGIPVGVGEDFEYQTSKETFLAYRCRDCGVVYLNPRPSPEEFSRIYPSNYHAFEFSEEDFGLSYQVRKKLELNRLRSAIRSLPRDAHILDVGCGDGFHLRVLKEIGKPGWTLEGIDADSRAVEVARRSGLNVRCATVESLADHSSRYHLILLIMTIEHVDDPLSLLKSIHRLLVPSGRLLIVTDNVGSPDFQLFKGRHWGGYHFPRHTYLFDQKSLTRLAIKAGFTPGKSGTSMSPVNWTYSIRNWLFDWKFPRFLYELFSLKSAVGLGAFTVFDSLMTVIGKGGNLRCEFIATPAESEVREAS